jgi:hypothetical protein
LESLKCQQQYFGQKNVIFEAVWSGASPTQNKAPAIKTRSLSSAYYCRFDILAKKKILTYKKTTESAEYFDM